MRWLRGHPLLALGILALLILLPGPVLLQVNLDNAPESYFPEDAAAVTFDRELRERFPQDQVLVGLFTGSDLFEADFLERIDALARDMEADPAVERVLSVTTLDHIRATADGFTVDRLVDGRALDERTPEQWRERVLRDHT